MLRFEVGPDDLLHSKFALSPVFDLENLLRILSRRAVPRWGTRLLPAFRRLRQQPAMQALLALQTPRKGPTFTVPPPTRGMQQSIEDDLVAVRAVPLAVARADISSCLAERPLTDPELLAVLQSADVLETMATLLEQAWHELVAADWPRWRAICERDVVYRSGQLAGHGWAAALDGLHPGVRWHNGGIELGGLHHDETISLGGQGLMFIPAIFSYPHLSTHFEEPWPKSLIYPARGRGTPWSAPQMPSEALQELIGKSRALILQALSEPASTTQLARSLNLATGSTNDHLRAMQRAGVLEAARSGRSVLYRRTPLGEALTGAGS